MSLLGNLLVVSVEQAVAAPLVTRQLADAGARVIKVERPDSGDFARDYDRTVNGESSYFVWLNRGKESIELDLRSPNDCELLNRMIKQADVFVQNLAPGASERLHLDAATLRDSRHSLIHCSISGYGAPGPYAHKKAYDLLLQCETGLLEATGTPEAAAKVGISIADIATGMYALSGILLALIRRGQSGAGATLSITMLDALADWMMQPAYYTTYGRGPHVRSGTSHASIAPYGPHRTADGYIFLGVQNDREWTTLCRDVIGREALIQDARFAHNPERVAHRAELTAELEERFTQSTSEDLLSLLDVVGIANARVRRPDELLEHPQLSARERWRSIETASGPVTALLPPVTFDDWEPSLGRVPALGQDNHALRSEFAEDSPPQQVTS